MQIYKQQCISSDKKEGMASLEKLEEHRSDVNLATATLLDAMTGAVDAFMLISGDSDLAGPVAAIRYRINPTFLIIGKLEKVSDGNCGLSASFGNIAA